MAISDRVQYIYAKKPENSAWRNFVVSQPQDSILWLYLFAFLLRWSRACLARFIRHEAVDTMGLAYLKPFNLSSEPAIPVCDLLKSLAHRTIIRFLLSCRLPC